MTKNEISQALLKLHHTAQDLQSGWYYADDKGPSIDFGSLADDIKTLLMNLDTKKKYLMKEKNNA